MDASRVSTGELIAGAGGLALFVFLFLDWLDTGLGGASGWQLFDFMDIVLAVIGLGTVAVVAARAMGTELPLPGGSNAIGLAGFAAFWIVVTFVIEGEGREIGLWLALLATIAIVYGAVSARGNRPPASRTGGGQTAA